MSKLDRLARNVTHMWEIVRRLDDKGVALRILDIHIDTGSPTGKLILSVMGGIAEFERSMMLERQREGIAKAKSEGRFKGRKPTTREQASEVKEFASQGLSIGAIATILGIEGEKAMHRFLTADICPLRGLRSHRFTELTLILRQKFLPYGCDDQLTVEPARESLATFHPTQSEQPW